MDGIELEGAEWKSKHKWSDNVTDSDLQKAYGDDWESHKGETYTGLYHNKIGGYLESHEGESSNDCADFSMYNLVHFAYDYALPLHFQKDNGPVYDNDNYGYKKKGKTHTFEEGNWQGFANAIGEEYGSMTLYNTTYFKAVEVIYNPFRNKNDPEGIDNVNNIAKTKAGDLVVMSYSGGHGHAQLIHSVGSVSRGGKKWYIYWTIQSSYNVDEQGNPVPTKAKRKLFAVSEDGKWILYTDPGKVGEKVKAEAKVIRWNFNYFDENL